MSIKIHINVDTPYDIYLGAGSLNQLNWLDILGQHAKRIVVISDTTVSGYYKEKLLSLWAELTPLWLSFPDGEEHKTRQTKALLEDQLQEAGCNRDTCIIAVGGGVVCDMAGFVAATYNRGVPVIYIPTTLLAMVDASVGGKTGVNTAIAKNSIGAFCQPKAIYMDIDFLKTLPDSELKNGLAEIVKHTLIKDKAQFQRLITFKQQHPQERWLLSDESWLLEIIAASINIKKDIVVCDEKETGLRQILNFGHTLGHVIEQLSAYQVPHGQAVAIGLYAESYLSYHCGYLPLNDFLSIEQSLRGFQFNLKTPYLLDSEKVAKALAVDKKVREEQWRVVVLEAIGKVCASYVMPFGDKELQATLAWYGDRV